MKQMKPSKRQTILFTILVAVIALFPIQTATSQTSSGTTVKIVPQVSTARTNETLTINITINDVPNLYGIDVTLNWNTSILQVLNVDTRLGVEAYLDGVLHGNSLSYDAGSMVSGDILVKENITDQETGEYHIAAACVGIGDSFNGSGTIAILTFKVLTMGHSELTLLSELADRPVADETISTPIDHTDISGSVDVVIPEFPSITIVIVLLASVAATLLYSKKTLKKNQSQVHAPTLKV